MPQMEGIFLPANAERKQNLSSLYCTPTTRSQKLTVLPGPLSATRASSRRFDEVGHHVTSSQGCGVSVQLGQSYFIPPAGPPLPLTRFRVGSLRKTNPDCNVTESGDVMRQSDGSRQAP